MRGSGVDSGHGTGFAPSPKKSGTTALDGSRFDLDDTTLANKSTFIRVQRISTTIIYAPQHPCRGTSRPR